VSRMLTASEALARLLPPAALAAPPPDESHHQDPRQVMWEIYRQMRERGEVPPEGWHQHRINELEAEIAALKAQLVDAGLTPALPDANSSVRRTNLAITPGESDVVPPGEYLGVPPMSGPDDPPKTPPVIDARPNPPAASAPAKPVRPQNWDDTPGGKAWRAWVDAGGNGGPGFDRWSNRNGA
jgi:hypothetical protein